MRGRDGEEGGREGPRSWRATVGVGANLGDREATIRAALRWLGRQEGNRLGRCSSLYETEPYGSRDQPWFLNCVVQVETRLGVRAFFGLLRACEARFGREREERWGPRTLDLDLLFFGDTVYRDADLTIPHPDVPNRRFVLQPLCEIDENLVHPVLGERVRRLLERLEDDSEVICVGPPPVEGEP